VSAPCPLNSCVLHTDYGRKRFVKRKQIQELLLSGANLEQIRPNEYRYRAQIFHSFQELQPLVEQISTTEGKAYLPGQFIWELAQKRRRERMETPEGMALRLATA